MRREDWGEVKGLFLPTAGSTTPQQDEKTQLCRRKLTVTVFDPQSPEDRGRKTTRQWLFGSGVSSTLGLLIRTEGGLRESFISAHRRRCLLSNILTPKWGFAFLAVDSVRLNRVWRSNHQDNTVLTKTEKSKHFYFKNCIYCYKKREAGVGGERHPVLAQCLTPLLVFLIMLRWLAKNEWL